MSHFSASSHLEGKFFLLVEERLFPTLKLKIGLPGVGGAETSLLLCVGGAETSRNPPLLSGPLTLFEVGNAFTNSEVSLRLSLQSGSGKVSTLFLLQKPWLPSKGAS